MTDLYNEATHGWTPAEGPVVADTHPVLAFGLLVVPILVVLVWFA